MFNFFRQPIEKVKAKCEKELLIKEDCLAVGIGNKIKNGVDTGKLAICIFVKKKKPDYLLSPAARIPKRIDGWQTDVIETDEFLPMNNRQRIRPVQGSIIAKVEGGTSCTAGLVCWKNGVQGVLTNEHCLHTKGQNNTGKRYLQPSPIDLGSPERDMIGIINSSPIIRNDRVNRIDSAFVPLSVPGEEKIFGIGDYPKRWIEPKLGMRVMKIGRTTGRTEGVISHINIQAKSNFGGNLGLVKFFPTFFVRQTNFNVLAGGDSGSIVFALNKDGSIAGIVGQGFLASSTLAIFLYGLVIRDDLQIELDKPEIGFLALGKWLTIRNLEITTNARTNLRSSPEIENNIIRILPVGTKLEITGIGGVSNNLFWIGVTIK